MRTCILAHDLGTSGNKAALFLEDGIMIGSRTYAYDAYYENRFWAEQDAHDWWKAVCETTKSLLAEYHILPEEVKAVSFSGQMMGCLPVDNEGKPLRRAMIWADQRAQKQSGILEQRIDQKRFYQIVGHRNTPSYGIQKAMWLKEHEPETYEQTYRFLNAKDYIVFQLTGKFYTDVSDANSMGCIDLAQRKWSEEIIERSGIDYDKFPEIVESTFMVGTVTARAAEATGLSESTKVVMGAGDGVAANVGAGSVKPGNAYCCIGTSAWVAATSEKPVLDREMRTVCWAHAVPGLFSPNGTMQYAGGTYSWFKNTICTEEVKKAREEGISPYSLIDREIVSCAPLAGGVRFLPYLMGERAPRWNPNATGVFFGLSAGTTRAQICRSVMEGILMNLSICLDILEDHTKADEILFIGGCARSRVWQRTMADVYGTNVLVPRFLEEANSMGAAVIAGVGSGIYKDFSAINRFIEITDRIEYEQETYHKYQRAKREFNRIYHALEPLF